MRREEFEKKYDVKVKEDSGYYYVDKVNELGIATSQFPDCCGAFILSNFLEERPDNLERYEDYIRMIMHDIGARYSIYSFVSILLCYDQSWAITMLRAIGFETMKEFTNAKTDNSLVYLIK